MKCRTFGVSAALRCGVVVMGMSLSWAVSAADDLDVTMRMVVDDAELTNSVVREIELPMARPSELPQGQTESAVGVEAAKDARNSRREFGTSAATEARSDMVREKPELPAKPERPATPETPVRPERPERPDSVRDKVQNIKDKTPPGLNR